MDLHTPRKKADWEAKRASGVNVWQRIAVATNGVLTPGNIVSVTGLILVLQGAVGLSDGRWVEALFLVAAGRLADVFDGFVANRTKTKSRLGEAVDTSCDKVGMFALAIAAVISGAMPLYVIVVVGLYHLCLAIFALVWGRRYNLHTTKWGKLAMAASWLVTTASIIHTYMPDVVTLSISILSGIVFVVLAVASLSAYWRMLSLALARREAHASWVRQVTEVVHVYNPRASNYRRAEKTLQELRAEAGWSPKRYDIRKESAQLKAYLRRRKASATVLVTVAGGDGTVSGVMNMLMNLYPDTSGPTLYVLPLWGGNANDFSCMLNGQHAALKSRRIVRSASPVPVPLIRLDVGRLRRTETIYACCYASFGASAFAARRLDASRPSASGYLRWIPPLLVLRELVFVVRALLESPVNKAEIDSREVTFYEHSLINGSRLAKVNRIPVQIDEPVFFHALVERKHPSILVSMARILLRRPDTVYARKKALRFTTKQPIEGQVDGEVMHMDADTGVSAKIVFPEHIRCISTNIQA